MMTDIQGYLPYSEANDTYANLIHKRDVVPQIFKPYD
jgi:hypothetical protein